jgi:hypothetical protein
MIICLENLPYKPIYATETDNFVPVLKCEDSISRGSGISYYFMISGCEVQPIYAHAALRNLYYH